jgi:putative oxidoreductase
MVSSERVSLVEALSANAHWFIRLGLAAVFLYHGLQKFQNLEGFASMMNLPYGVALLVALAEVGGAVFIVAGALISHWLTRIGAAMFIPVMLGAIFMVHWPQWSFVPSESHPMGGMEFQVVLLLTSIYFVVKGNKA